MKSNGHKKAQNDFDAPRDICFELCEPKEEPPFVRFSFCAFCAFLWLFLSICEICVICG